MSTAREKFFLCSFSSRSRRISRQVRAWDERQAALLFQEELEDEGVKAGGTVRVTDLTGRLDERYEYQPEVHA
jgi:hypothetical protein